MISDVKDDGSGTTEYDEFLKVTTHKILNRNPQGQIPTLQPELPGHHLLLDPCCIPQGLAFGL